MTYVSRLPMLTLGLLLLAQPVLASDENSELAQAKSLVSQYAGALKSELVTAMSEGGPMQAVRVCNIRAPEIAQAVSRESGAEISRVSQKNRNPDAEPNDWQRTVLESFESQRASGVDPASLAWHATSDTEHGREFRFMKAIPTGAICLACHGERIDPSVQEKLRELYPDDRATGYQEGQIRGAFVVTRALD